MSILYGGLAQIPIPNSCNVQIRSSFDSECMLTTYPQIIPKDIKSPIAIPMEISVIHNFFPFTLASDFRACKGSTVIYTAETGTNVVHYSWSVSGAASYYVLGNGSSISVTWGNGSSGRVTVDVNTSGDNSCRASVSIQLINSPTIASSTIPPYYTNGNGDKIIEVCMGESIAFIDESIAGSTPIIGHLWESDEFGNSATQNYSITPTQPGSYHVRHSVSNECGCEDWEDYKIIVLKASSKLELSCYGTVCAGSTKTYTAYSPHCDPYFWWIEGGTIISGQGSNTITVQWGNPDCGYGIISLDQSLCEGDCPTLSSVKIPIISDGAQISGPAEICEGDHAIFEAPLWGSTAYYWEVTPSAGATLFGQHTNNELGVQFDIPGTYTISLSYDCDFIDCGRFEAVSKTVIVKKYLQIQSSSDGITCQGSTISFNTNHQGGVNWKIYNQNNTQIDSSTATTLNYTFNTDGAYIVRATHADYCNSPDFNLNIIRRPNPINPTYIDYPSLACAGEHISLEYNRPNSISNTLDVEWVPSCSELTTERGDIVNYEFQGTCDFSVYLVDIENNNCRSTARTIHIEEFSLIPIPDTIIYSCVGGRVEIDFLNQLGVDYEWNILPAHYATLVNDHTDGNAIIDLNRVQATQSEYDVTVSVKRTYCAGSTNTGTITIRVQNITEPQINVPASTCQNETITLTAIGSDMDDSHYTWEIEGTLYAGKVISTAFNESGNKRIKLLYSPFPFCEVIEVYQDIVIKELPNGGIMASSVSNGKLLEVPSNPNYSYQWLKNNSLIANATQNSLIVSTYGHYCCETTDNTTGCINRNCYIHYVVDSLSTPDCLPIILNYTRETCNNYTITAQNPGNLTINWNFSGSNNYQYSSLNNNQISFTTTGNGSFIIAATASDGDDCYAGVLPINVSLTPDFNISVNCNNRLTISDQSSAFTPSQSPPVFSYSIDHGTPIYIYFNIGETNRTMSLPTITNTSDLTVNMYHAGCTLTKNMTVYPLAVVSSIAAPEAICSETPFQVTAQGTGMHSQHWTFGDNSSTTRTNPYHTYNAVPSETYIITFYAKNRNGCISNVLTKQITVNANPLSAALYWDVDYPCMGGHVDIRHINGSSSFSYIWNPGYITNNSPTHRVYKSGTYSMRVENSNGCIKQGRINVGFRAAPTAQIIGSTSYCEGDTIKLRAKTGTSYSYWWYNIGDPIAINQTSSISEVAQPGNRTIRLRVRHPRSFCEASDTIAITVASAPQTPTLTYVGNQCMTSPPVRLTSTQGNNLYWSNGFYGVSAPYYTTGWVNAYQMDFVSGCKSAKDSIFIHPHPNFDALLTGCVQICKKKAENSWLPVYSFSPNILLPAWKWFHNNSNIYSGNGTLMNLPIRGIGSYYLDVFFGNNCNIQSPTLNIEYLDPCPCDGVDINVIEWSCEFKECRPILCYTVEICNTGSVPFIADDFYTNSPHHIVHWNPRGLVVHPGECEKFHFCIEVTDFSASFPEFVIYNREYDCEERFSVRIDWEDCIKNECNIDNFEFGFIPELSTAHQTSYFEFHIDFPQGTEQLLSFWTEPPHVIDYNYHGNTYLDGLLMFNFGQISQLAANDDKICFNAIICIKGELCFVRFCIPAKELLDRIPPDYRSLTSQSNGENEIIPEASPEKELIEDNEKLYLAPNPAQNEVTILGTNPENIKEVMILDMNGRQVQETKKNHRFNVASIPTATYIVRIITTENKVHYLKLIKQ